MNKDIRIATGFRNHRKRKRLVRELGKGAEVYLIDLWITVAIDCPEGVLIGWDEIDIADAAGWEGDPDIFVSALINTIWLEKNNDGDYAIHDWCEHQGWACKAQVRSDVAGKNVLLRWTLKEVDPKEVSNFKKWFTSVYSYQKGHSTNSILTLYQSYTNRNTPSPLPLPSPNPSPCPTLPEVINYFKENGYQENLARKAFLFYNSANWFDSKGNKVLNWKQKLSSWFKDDSKLPIIETQEDVEKEVAEALG